MSVENLKQDIQKRIDFLKNELQNPKKNLSEEHLEGMISGYQGCLTMLDELATHARTFGKLKTELIWYGSPEGIKKFQTQKYVLLGDTEQTQTENGEPKNE